MEDEQLRDAPVETPWAFAIGDATTCGEVIWRRENALGARDYLIRTADGEQWHPESDLAA